MGKKKKKGLIKGLDLESKEMLNFIINGEYIEPTEEKVESLIDDENYVDPARVANLIKKRVERGENASDIAYYSHRALKDVCSYLQIPGRSEFTRKKEMASAIVKFFGGKKKQWKNI